MERPQLYPCMVLTIPELPQNREFMVGEDGKLLFRQIVTVPGIMQTVNKDGTVFKEEQQEMDLECGRLAKDQTWLPVDLDHYNYLPEAKEKLVKWREFILKSRKERTGKGWKFIDAKWNQYRRWQALEGITEQE